MIRALGGSYSLIRLVSSPANPQSWNRYAYVLNNPVRYSDPSGHKACERQDEYWNCVPETPVPLPPQGGGTSNPPVPRGVPTPPGIGLHRTPTPTSQPALPILPQPALPSVVPSHEGYSDPDLDALLWFWDNVASPFFDSAEMYDIYRLSGKGGYKAVTYSLPTGPIEAGIAAFRQGYRDSWTQNLTPAQRVLRMGIVAGETYLTDVASTLSGDFGAVVGLSGGPVGAAAGYGVSAYLVTVAGNRFWANTVNPNIPGLGVWP